MKEKVLEIWPEIDWIKNKNLRSQTLDAWVYAIEQSPLDPKDLEEIQFSLLIKDCNISFKDWAVATSSSLFLLRGIIAAFIGDK